MAKNLGEVINNIMEENASNRVLILTNHLQIIGTIHEYHNKCDNCHDCLIALKDVKLAELKIFAPAMRMDASAMLMFIKNLIGSI